jgi:hypothetical protein
MTNCLPSIATALKSPTCGGGAPAGYPPQCRVPTTVGGGSGANPTPATRPHPRHAHPQVRAGHRPGRVGTVLAPASQQPTWGRKKES